TVLTNRMTTTWICALRNGQAVFLNSPARAILAGSTKAFQGRIMVAAETATGNDQAHSPIVEMAIAAMTHPSIKPKRRYRDRFNRAPSALIRGCPRDSASMIERTVLVRLPVITAVEIAPGSAKRSSAY